MQYIQYMTTLWKWVSLNYKAHAPTNNLKILILLSPGHLIVREIIMGKLPSDT